MKPSGPLAVKKVSITKKWSTLLKLESLFGSGRGVRVGIGQAKLECLEPFHPNINRRAREMA